MEGNNGKYIGEQKPKRRGTTSYTKWNNGLNGGNNGTYVGEQKPKRPGTTSYTKENKSLNGGEQQDIRRGTKP
jgi:hypothetical protein